MEPGLQANGRSTVPRHDGGLQASRLSRAGLDRPIPLDGWTAPGRRGPPHPTGCMAP